MLVEKEIIRPGSYWYTDEKSGLPRRLVVTPDLTKYWNEQGGKMLAAGLTVPVPYEHDFNAHPMTPKDKVLNNAGEVKEYRLRDLVGKNGKAIKDVLFGVVDVQDPDAKRKIGHSIRWTSPWINSFVDGNGQQWNNVISHLALTTRPRIIEQAPFGSTTTALSMATEVKVVATSVLPPEGICLSKAGALGTRKKSKRLCPRYPMAFSLMSGVAMSDDDMPPMAKKKGKPGKGGDDFDEGGDDFEDDGFGDSEVPDDGDPTNDSTVDLAPYGDPKGDVQMEEVLCDLLSAMGIHCEHSGDEASFKRSLYTAAMTKIHELTAKGMGSGEPKPGEIGKQTQAGKPPAAGAQPNPLIQQEQQPMYMSLEDINKLPEPMRGVALAMYAENQRMRTELDASKKVTDSLRDAKLREAATVREQRVGLLGRLSPRAKTDLDAMLALPTMALSMGDGGAVVDPMAQTLAVLEKGLADMPRLLTTDMASLSVQPQPRDGDELTDEQSDKLADDMARKMGAPPERKVG